MRHEEESTNGYVTQEKAEKIADRMLYRMKLDDLISWNQWWEKFVVPCDEEPEMDFQKHRHAIKELIIKEFEARKISNRLFVDHRKGVFMLDGPTAVAARFFLDRVKKVSNCVHSTVDKCHELALADGISDQDSRMLQNASGTIDGNFTMLAGAIGRMRSIPNSVKILALAHLGVDIGGE